MVKVWLKSGNFPRMLILSGVTCDTIFPAQSGHFACIFKGMYKSTSVAIKLLKIREDKNPGQRRKSSGREALAAAGLSHPRILPLLGISNTVYEDSLCLVTPWMEHGSVRDAIGEMEKDSSLCRFATRAEQYIQWIVEISLGLEYLHSENVVHGDLRGANILIDSQWSVRLADFGLSVFGDETSGGHGSTRGGNDRWLPPEILSDTSLSYRPTQAGDVYSFACTTVEIFTNRKPLAHIVNDRTVGPAVRRGERSRRPGVNGQHGYLICDCLWNIVQQCWSENIHHRPVANTLSKRLSNVLLHHKHLGQCCCTDDLSWIRAVKL